VNGNNVVTCSAGDPFGTWTAFMYTCDGKLAPLFVTLYCVTVWSRALKAYISRFYMFSPDFSEFAQFAYTFIITIDFN
jgi:hypothetical protein